MRPCARKTPKRLLSAISWRLRARCASGIWMEYGRPRLEDCLGNRRRIKGDTALAASIVDIAAKQATYDIVGKPPPRQKAGLPGVLGAVDGPGAKPFAPYFLGARELAGAQVFA